MKQLVGGKRLAGGQKAARRGCAAAPLLSGRACRCCWVQVAIERFGEGASSSSDDSSDESSDEELEGGVAPMEAEASVQGAAVQKKGGGGGKGHGTHLAPAAGARVGRRRVKVVKNKKRRAGIEVIG